MGKTKRKSAEVEPEDVEGQKAEALPDREVMSTISVEPQPVVGDDPLFAIDPVPKHIPPGN